MISRRERHQMVTMTNWFVRIILGGFVFVAIFANFLASDLPIFAKRNGKTEWPIFVPDKYYGVESNAFADYDEVIYPLIPFKHQDDPNLDERLVAPGTQSVRASQIFTHFLGTDRLGRDVAAGLVFGCRKSIFIAFFSVIVALFVGLILGGTAGYWGNDLKIRWSWYFLFWLILTLYGIYCIFYGLFPLSLIVVFIGVTFLPILFFQGKAGKSLRIPIDFLVIKSIEILQSIPGLIILLVMASVIRSPSLLLLAIVISLIRWTGFARFIRAEVIKIKSRDYITAAKISGLSHWKIATRYIMPEAFGPLIVVFAFGISSVVILESTLSFLGIGLPVDEVTWGTLLGQAKQNPHAWWLAVFPGLCILLLVLCLNLTGDHIKRKFDVRD